MEPCRDIRFCKASDGVELAVAQHGSGPPLVKVADWLMPVELDYQHSPTRHVYDEFSRDHAYVTYDSRGCGLSQRRVDDVSLNAWVRDLEAVVDGLRLQQFSLQGFSYGAAVAVAYAARHPKRVSRLVLLNGLATAYLSTSKQDPAVREEAETLAKIVKIGWGDDGRAFRQVFASKCLPDGTAEQLRWFDEVQTMVAPEMALRYIRAVMSINVKQEASQVSSPTLVCHVRNAQMIYFEQGRRLAAMIPGARFVPLEGRNLCPSEIDPGWATFVREVREFLGTATAAPRVTLTTRQIQVLQRVAAGQTDKQIARDLSLSPRTVEMHVAGAMRALGVKTRAEATHRATQQRLLPP